MSRSAGDPRSGQTVAGEKPPRPGRLKPPVKSLMEIAASLRFSQ
ncbi:hypothetical protein [Thiogranum longum]|nr:hypothetical protein [Thiogranum longum]